jgi:DNA polymerase III delta prime subunit
MSTSDSHIVELITGYLPGRTRRVNDIASSLAQPADTLFRGPNCSARDIHEIIAFTRVRPLDRRSVARVVIIDMEPTRRSSQTSLLRILEETPPYVKFILTAAEPLSVMETIRSRCIIETFAPPSYGEVIRDLAQTGMSMNQAAKSATHVMEGVDIAHLPDDQSLYKAKSFIEELQAGNTANSLRLALDFEQHDMDALRQELLRLGAINLLSATYEVSDIISAVMNVVVETNQPSHT